MKAKYCSCLGVKLSAVGQGDIGEDFGSVGLSNQEAPVKVHYCLKCSEVEWCRLPPCRVGAKPTGSASFKLPPFLDGKYPLPDCSIGQPNCVIILINEPPRCLMSLPLALPLRLKRAAQQTNAR